MRLGNTTIEEIYLFTGNDEVRKKAKINRILECLSKSSSVVSYDLETTLLQEAIMDCLTIPFLADTKVVILKNPKFLTRSKSSARHDIRSFQKYLKNPVSSTVLIIDAGGLELDQSSETYKLLQKCAYINDTKPLDDLEYKTWVLRSINKENVDIREDALNLLIDKVKDNPVKMETEISKVLSYIGNRKRITEDDIKEVVCRDHDENVFLLTKAIMAHDREKVISFYEDYLVNSPDNLGVLSLIGKTLNEMLIVHKLLLAGYTQAGIAEKLEIKGGRAYYLVRDAKLFKESILESNLKKIALLDYQIKTGLVDKNLGLELLLLEI